MKEIKELTIYNVKEDVEKRERQLSKIDGYYDDHNPFRPPPKIVEYWLNLWSTSEALGLSGVYDTVLLDKYVLIEYRVDEILTVYDGVELFYHNKKNSKIYFSLYMDKVNIPLDEKTIKILVEYMGCESYTISFEKQVDHERPFMVCINGIKKKN